MVWRRPITRFAFATLTPVALLLIACFAGGWWPVVALVYMTGVVSVMDHLIAGMDVPEGSEFPAEGWLAVTLGLLHFPLLAAGVLALTGATGIDAVPQVVLFLGLGLFFGQVSNSNAHELIHHPSRWMKRLGMWVYISLLYGHHTSAHVRVHHVYVGSDQDPATARQGESFYRYAIRAWKDGFWAGWAAERDLSARSAKWRLNPYVFYLSAMAFILVLAVWSAGVPGVVALIMVAVYAQMQLLMSDYVQHYGLRRKIRENGKLEPIGPQHAWNAPHWLSSAMMLNAPRHSDHHVNPSRSYSELRLGDDMPVLPYSLPIMATLALWPGVWRRVMDRRVAHWI